MVSLAKYMGGDLGFLHNLSLIDLAKYYLSINKLAAKENEEIKKAKSKK